MNDKMNDTTMTTALTTVPADGPFSPSQIDLIRSQIAPDASDDQLAFFLEVCRGTGLNPFMRQIYAIFRNAKENIRSADGKDNWRTVKRMTIQTGIDGYRLLAARTGSLAGIDDATFDTEDEEHPNKASVTVWRFVAGHRIAFTATARWREYAQEKDVYDDGKKTGRKIPTEMWAKMPYGMLAKCAEALALRKAFPAELSGVYTHEEMMQAENHEPLPMPVTTATASSTASFVEGEVVADSNNADDSNTRDTRDEKQRAESAAQVTLVQSLKEGNFGTLTAVERFLADTLKRRMTIAALQRGASNITIGEVAQVTSALAARREAQKQQQQQPQDSAAANEEANNSAAANEEANNFEDLPILNESVKP